MLLGLPHKVLALFVIEQIQQLLKLMVAMHCWEHQLRNRRYRAHKQD